MLASPWRIVAHGFGAGLSPWAPGTVGTAWAWLAFVIASPWMNDVRWSILLCVAFAGGVVACARTARDLGVGDPGSIVWDEIVAFWAVLWIAGGGLATQAAAFVIFRFFDAVKPPPVGFVDRRVSGGLGVMLDDLVAGAMTLFALALWRAW